MTFEILISCHMPPNDGLAGISEMLEDALNQALEYSPIDFDESMIQIHCQRPLNEAPADRGNLLVGFSLELPEDDAGIKSVVDGFVGALRDRSEVMHLVRFEDPLLQAELSKWAAEIFSLEMKLRRVLSFIYLHAYQVSNPFELLQEEQVQIPQGVKPQETQMNNLSENEFFHLTFSQYIGLNQRRQIDLRHIVGIILDSEQYGDLRQELMRSPVSDGRDTELMNNLQQHLNAIERMRNCVAHNRRPSEGIRQDYSFNRPRLEELLDSYLASLAIQH